MPAGWRSALQTPARIYYKYEGVSPAGSHKPNTAVAQAYYNKEQGIHRIATETGAGQWGSALAFAGQLFGIEIKVYMVRVSYDQKPYRRNMMETWGAKVVASPSPDTNAGRKVLAEDPKCSGSLGLAISEAVEDAVTSKTPTKYSLGSVLNHVLMHQTVIGLGGQEADGHGRRLPRRPDRLRRRRQQLRGLHLPVPAGQAHGQGAQPACRGDRADRDAEPDARRLRLRLRRHRDA